MKIALGESKDWDEPIGSADPYADGRRAGHYLDFSARILGKMPLPIKSDDDLEKEAREAQIAKQNLVKCACAYPPLKARQFFQGLANAFKKPKIDADGKLRRQSGAARIRNWISDHPEEVSGCRNVPELHDLLMRKLGHDVAGSDIAKICYRMKLKLAKPGRPKTPRGE